MQWKKVANGKTVVALWFPKAWGVWKSLFRVTGIWSDEQITNIFSRAFLPLPDHRKNWKEKLTHQWIPQFMEKPMVQILSWYNVLPLWCQILQYLKSNTQYRFCPYCYILLFPIYNCMHHNEWEVIAIQEFHVHINGLLFLVYGSVVINCMGSQQLCNICYSLWPQLFTTQIILLILDPLWGDWPIMWAAHGLASKNTSRYTRRGMIHTHTFCTERLLFREAIEERCALLKFFS